MRKVYKLLDRSLVLATEIDESQSTFTVKEPISITQTFNPQTGQPDIVMIPMDLIFAEVAPGKNIVEFKKDHVMYDKPMSDFPTYEQNYIAHTTGIETVEQPAKIIT